MNYRKIWEEAHGPIPKDENGVTYDIHHIDGNRKNNNISNLIALSIEDHYKIHLQQFNETKSHKDKAALVFLAKRLGKSQEIKGHIVSEETKEKIRKSLTGRKRPTEIGEKIKSKMTGYKWSDEIIQKRREGLKKSHDNMSVERRLEINKKLSESHKGRITSEDTKLKLAKINAKLSDDEVREVHQLIKEGVGYKLISEQYKISQSQISSLKQGKTYYWVDLN